jgi:nucleoside-diphosphate-sugar epimerase
MKIDSSSGPPGKLHTILGAGGAIATELTRELLKANHAVRLVSRQPRASGSVVETFPADISDFRQTLEAVKGSAFVYLCVGLKYDLRIWQALWPTIMKNTIEACKFHGARLIFFDNVYMYGQVDGPMSEATPYNPCSKKGEIRARIATQLMDETKAGNLTAIIARAADFYGPSCRTSILNLLVIDRLAAGKRAWWLANDQKRHSFTFTPDAARALVRLAAEESAYQQVWHLPTARPALTGREWIDLCAEVTKQSSRRLILTRPMVRILGFFDRTVREMHEMLYQNETDYVFDSSKIEVAFGLAATTLRDGVQQTVNAL